MRRVRACSGRCRCRCWVVAAVAAGHACVHSARAARRRCSCGECTCVRVMVGACGRVHVPVGASRAGTDAVRRVQYTAGPSVPNVGGADTAGAQRMRDEWWMRARWMRLVRRWAYGYGCGKWGMTYVQVGGRCGECRRTWQARARRVTDTDAVDTEVCVGGSERLGSGRVRTKESASSRTVQGTD